MELTSFSAAGYELADLVGGRIHFCACIGERKMFIWQGLVNRDEQNEQVFLNKISDNTK